MQRKVQAWLAVDSTAPDEPVRLPVEEMRKALQGTSASERMHKHSDGTWTQLDAPTNVQSALSLHAIRNDNLPLEWQQPGVIKPISIGDDAGIAEGTHFMFVGNSLLLTLYNHYGPRPARLGEWLQQRFNLPARFVPVVRDDVREQLAAMSGVRTFHVSASALALRELGGSASAGSILARVNAAAEPAGVASIDVDIRFESESHGLSQVFEFIQQLRESEAHWFPKSARIRGRRMADSTLVNLDLLSDRVALSVDVLPESPRVRTVDSEAANAALRDAYQTLQSELERHVPGTHAACLPFVGLNPAPRSKRVVP